MFHHISKHRQRKLRLVFLRKIRDVWKCECLIQLLKQIRTSGENEEESLANLWITVSKPATLVIFRLSLPRELIMSLRISREQRCLQNVQESR